MDRRSLHSRIRNTQRATYVFLGRHRVLVEASSRLKVYLEDLKSQSRLTKMADTIALLKQDEAGYPPKELSSIL
jgi:hypothetical protein